MNLTVITTPETESVTLSPSYNLPLAIILLAVPVGLLNLWVGLVVGLFGAFLIAQTATIRLKFTQTALEVYRSEQIIREFPYADWLTWRIFWTNVPILFYFREVKSIHFLPIIFDSQTLKLCLEKYCSKE